ncbi:MAG: LysR substrate-binding domain-containing protein [Paracoccus sp. (in: a-proteobacteria)]|uniref:LysR family transcriptional regulator n=1 Tax=Paracoccus sp. TaxID=267 RepID=UPI0026E01CBD|nr:LysR family transcriptional regulator [Paracoccus sp. (in: a-proteobacteria)]MDO5613165.1 LysR substrate-binding domain-containing protein [Paracoccus sp. (in: a-proteobacteria)]
MQKSPQSFDEITAFAAVADQGSFVAAARAIGVDASLISRRVRRLEERLRTRLLARTTRRVALTEAGARYHLRVRNLLEQLDAAGREAADLAAAPQGVLRVSAPQSFGMVAVAPLLADFIARWPDIRLDLSLSNRRVDLLADGYDLAIRMGQPQDSSLTMRKLGEYRDILVAAPAYIAARGMPDHPRDLTNHACLGFTGNAFWPEWSLTDGRQIHDLRPQGPLVCDSSDALLTAALDGAGILLATDWLAQPALISGRMVRVLPDWQGRTEGAIHALMPPGRMIPAKVQVFLDALTARLLSCPHRSQPTRPKQEPSCPITPTI